MLATVIAGPARPSSRSPTVRPPLTDRALRQPGGEPPLLEAGAEGGTRRSSGALQPNQPGAHTHQSVASGPTRRAVDGVSPGASEPAAQVAPSAVAATSSHRDDGRRFQRATAAWCRRRTVGSGASRRLTTEVCRQTRQFRSPGTSGSLPSPRYRTPTTSRRDPGERQHAGGAGVMSTMRPSRRNTTRSACSEGGSWVTSTTAVPVRAGSAASVATMSSLVIVSSAPAGSSARISRRSPTSALAMAMRCC